MTFVETPRFFDRQVALIEFLEGKPKGADGAFENRGVGNVKRVAFFF